MFLANILMHFSHLTQRCNDHFGLLLQSVSYCNAISSALHHSFSLSFIANLETTGVAAWHCGRSEPFISPPTTLDWEFLTNNDPLSYLHFGLPPAVKI